MVVLFAPVERIGRLNYTTQDRHNNNNNELLKYLSILVRFFVCACVGGGFNNATFPHDLTSSGSGFATGS
jgi:hypothetical protein